MRVLVCGGRDYWNRDQIWWVLGDLHKRRGPIAVLIHGNASGADQHSRNWARYHDIDDERYDADWQDLSHPDAVVKTHPDGRQYDAMAGPRRNKRMIDEGRPDLVVAFPGGTGTADMVKQAKQAGIEVIEVE